LGMRTNETRQRLAIDSKEGRAARPGAAR
jgi:hypothetical protein